MSDAVRDNAYGFGLTSEEANKFIASIDANNDNFIDFAEFCALISKAKRMHVNDLHHNR